MPELDHIFLCTDDPEGAQAVLMAFGLDLSRGQIHRGQGTANFCAFFDNAYFELLFAHLHDEMQSDFVRMTCAADRINWRSTGACPFGLALRGEGLADLATWNYAAPFLPPGKSLPIITPPDSPRQPLIFISPVSTAPAEVAAERGLPLVHAGSRRRLTGARFKGPEVARLDPGCIDTGRSVGAEFVEADQYHLELIWDDGREGASHDFAPLLPLTIQS